MRAYRNAARTIGICRGASPTWWRKVTTSHGCRDRRDWPGSQGDRRNRQARDARGPRRGGPPRLERPDEGPRPRSEAGADPSQKLGIRSLEGAAKGRRKGENKATSTVSGRKTEKNILDELDRLEAGNGADRDSVSPRRWRPDLEKFLKKVNGVKEVTVAGSYRRRRETVGDLDILATCKRPRG